MDHNIQDIISRVRVSGEEALFVVEQYIFELKNVRVKILPRENEKKLLEQAFAIAKSYFELFYQT